MPVTVMQVRIMRVLVRKVRVSVPVAMRLSDRIARCVIVLVMDVMHVPMLVFERLVQVLVLVCFGPVQIDANPHEQCRADQRWGWHFAKQWERKDSANKRSRRKIGAGTRGSQVAKPEHKERQTDAVAKEADRGPRRQSL